MRGRWLLALALALAGCEAERPGGGTLAVAVVGELAPGQSPAALDPARAMVTGATQLGLLAPDGAGGLAPALARSWNVSDDGLQYVFRLRDDARWADGRAITAGDAVVALRRALNPARAHPLRAALAPVAAIDSPAPGIVEIALSRPEPALLRLLAHPSLAVMRAGAEPPAAGPFVRSDPTAPAAWLTRNERYYDPGAVALAAVRVLPEPDPRAAIAAFRAGRADIVTGAATDGLLAALAVPDARALRIEPAWGVYGYAFGRDAPPPRVRRALNLALDRAELVARVFNVPAMRPMTGAAPPTVARAATPAWAAAPIEARRARARALLTEAGHGPEDPFVVTVEIPAGAEHAAVLREVARQWATVGVRVRGAVRAPAAHARRAAGGAFAAAQFERIAPAPLPGFFLRPLGAAEGEAAAAAEARLMAADRAVPLFTPARWSLVAAGVTGWTPNVAGAHPLARLDKLRAAGS